MGIGGSLAALGPTATLSYALARAGAKSGLFAWHRYRIIAVPVSAMPAMPRGHNARLIDAAELAGHAIDADAATQHARFGAGLACIGAFAGDQLVGVNWLATGHHDEDEVDARYVLPADAAWDTGLWVPPERRMGRAFAAIWAGTADWLAERGLARSMSRIADYNSASIAAHARMAARTVATVAFLSLGPVQFCIGARPRLGGATVDLRGC